MKSLNELQTMALGEFMSDYHDHCGPSEFNPNHNKISRSLVRAMLREHGSCFIWTCNPYGDEKVCREYKRGMVYNFEGTFITPHYDVNLERMMLNRLKLNYTGTRNDARLIDEIFNYAEKMDMVNLTWS